MSLSIDIGKRNLGYSLLSPEGLLFDLFDIEVEGKKYGRVSEVVKRCAVLKDFLECMCKEHNVQEIIIERQVPTNVICMELMYSLVSLSMSYFPMDCITIFDPKCKFTKIGKEYSTRGKEHKKLSVELIREHLREKFPEEVEKFESYAKKDDIADSLLMLLVHRGQIS